MVIDPGNRVVDQLYKVPVPMEFIFHEGRWIVKINKSNLILLIQKNKTRLYQMDSIRSLLLILSLSLKLELRG